MGCTRGWGVVAVKEACPLVIGGGVEDFFSDGCRLTGVICGG